MSPTLLAAAPLPPLCKRWWMCCDNRQRHGVCASSPNSSWQQPWSSCRIDQDSWRHADLFNAASLNTLSSATHNADTDRKSLSVCLMTETVKMFWASPTITGSVHLCTSLDNATKCGISCECLRCVYNEPGRNAVFYWMSWFLGCLQNLAAPTHLNYVRTPW